ncbi:conserved membrane hypothetical protein [Candidatus Accumulibacter aalborgensis]|uniref:Uncharacterized protein n=1 Tax=Candidatus Accumulibacter aalborgensis TaxID=1860102 RepID=A0A1A8XWX8_9PROT|nr:hypothetical protein [Candidatus Accumulibacter aalborgensis]SBT09489.1 conserved membrane hypothetical protein [Candidatus Accumulibacter aalborgensis]
MLIYLGLSAVVVFVAALLLLCLGHPTRPALAHLVFAVGIAPLIFGAITHFVPVLTRSGKAPRSLLLAPLLLQLAGTLAFFGLSGQLATGSLPLAAGGALLIALILAGWLVVRARHTLGRPHPGWRWYLAAVTSLCMALILVPAMTWWPAMRTEMRLLHLHLNTLGFIGLAALGTLQVLLPTVLSGPDADAAARLRRELPVAASSVLAIAIGAAFWRPLALAGAVMLCSVALNAAHSWLRRYSWRTLVEDGAAAGLVAALSGFLLLVMLGAAHAVGVLAGQDAVPAFVVGFLLPLITGALSQLLPVWYHPGQRTPVRDRMRAALSAGGASRSLLFVLGGVLLALGVSAGIWLAATGMLLFVVALLRSLSVTGPDRNSL